MANEQSFRSGKPTEVEEAFFEEFEAREIFYRDLRRCRREDRPGEPTRCAIVEYGEFGNPLRAVGEYSGDRLYRCIKRQVLVQFCENGFWYRIGPTRLGYRSTEFSSVESFEEFLNQIVRAFREPITVGDGELTLGVNIGATPSIQYNSDIDELLFELRASVRLAGEQELSSYELVRGPEERQQAQTLHVTDELFEALENDEFRLHYQPIVSLNDGSIEGVEALIRWQHPDHGLLYPGSFLPEVEQSGLITFLGSWTLEEGIRQLVRWDERSVNAGLISINLSPKQFRDPNLADRIQGLLSRHGVEAQRLLLEITEQTMVKDREQAKGQLSSLNEAGVQVAMDDFGTGYSSLSQLADLPIDVLKLDRSFVEHDSPTSKQRTMVELIIDSGKAMGLGILCEGIETESQWDWMVEEQCELAQGFYIAPGLPPDDLTDWINTYREDNKSRTQPPKFPSREMITEYLPEWFDS